MAGLERLAELTPIRPTRSLLGFAVELGCEPPRYLPVMPDESARPDACVLNVEEAVRRWGGSFCYGWLLRECSGLWISAQFRAVRMTKGGLLVDETPQSSGGDPHWALFARDPAWRRDRNFGQYPTFRRRRIYESAGPNGLFEQASPSEDGEAVLGPIATTSRTSARDPLPEAIDSYLRTLDDVEFLFVTSGTDRRCCDPEKVDHCYEQIARSRRRLLRLLEESEGGVV